MKSQKLVNRRLVLRGLGGVAVGLPMLDVFAPKGAEAQAAARPVYSALMLQQNGAIQGNGDDPLSSTVGSEAWNSRDLKSRPH